MGLAHPLKVPLRLFDTSSDLAGSGFGTMALTDPLGLDNTTATLNTTETTLVLGDSLLGGWGVHCKGETDYGTKAMDECNG